MHQVGAVFKGVFAGTGGTAVRVAIELWYGLEWQ